MGRITIILLFISLVANGQSFKAKDSWNRQIKIKTYDSSYFAEPVIIEGNSGFFSDGTNLYIKINDTTYYASDLTGFDLSGETNNGILYNSGGSISTDPNFTFTSNYLNAPRINSDTLQYASNFYTYKLGNNVYWVINNNTTALFTPYELQSLRPIYATDSVYIFPGGSNKTGFFKSSINKAQLRINDTSFYASDLQMPSVSWGNDTSIYLEAANGNYFDLHVGVGGYQNYYMADVTGALNYYIDAVGGLSSSSVNGNNSTSISSTSHYNKWKDGYFGISSPQYGSPARKFLHLEHLNYLGNGVGITMDTTGLDMEFEANGTPYFNFKADSSIFYHHVFCDKSLNLGNVAPVEDASLSFGGSNNIRITYRGNDIYGYHSNSLTWKISTGTFGFDLSGMPRFVGITGSTTSPNIVPDRSDTNTGINSPSDDNLVLIVGGVTAVRIEEDSVTMSGKLTSKYYSTKNYVNGAGVTVTISVSNTYYTIKNQTNKFNYNQSYTDSTITVAENGLYDIDFFASSSSGNVNRDVHYSLFIDDVEDTSFEVENRHITSGINYNQAFSGKIYLTAGSVLKVKTKYQSNTGTLTINHMGFSVTRVN